MTQNTAPENEPPGRASLRDRRVLVIGGTSGIGLAAARAAARLGAEVIVAGRSRGYADAAREALPEAAVERVNVAVAEDVQRLFERLGTVDHVALTAGGRAGGRVTDADLAPLREDLDTRFWGAVHVCRFAPPHLAHGGSITLCSGAVSMKPAPGRSVVSAMVNAVESLGRALALELAPIRVNTIVPGIVDSPRLRAALAGQADPAVHLASAYRHLPAGRAGHLDEIAQAFVFAMTNGYFTGQTLVVDGGYTLT